MPYFSFHYPPLYPLLLAPSFLSADHWYFWMLAVNALLNALTLILVWLLARHFLPLIPSLLGVALVALLPFLSVFPLMIMSENLLTPLLVGCLYTLLTLRRHDRGSSFLFGLLLAGSLATRHIAAPVVVVFLSWWWWKTQRRLLPRTRSRATLSIGQWGDVGFHATKLVEARRAFGAGSEVSTAVVTNLPRFVQDPSSLQQRLLFFGFPDQIVVADQVDCRVQTSDLILYLLLGEDSPGRALATYETEEGPIRVSGEINRSVRSRPCVLEFGPRSARVREAFHIDAAGRSSMWVKGRNFSDSTVVELDGHRITPRLSSPDLLTYTVPEEVLATPGEKMLRLIDTASGAESNPVHFAVYR